MREAVEEIRSANPAARIDYTAVDVTKSGSALAAAFADIAASHQRVDILINSAGIMREGYFESLADKDFRDVMDINFFGTLNPIRAALPYLKASRGRIVNIASVAGLMGVFGYTAYCSAKHALVGLTESLRFELEPQGISIQLVCPGEFDSPMADTMNEDRTPENREHTLTIPKLGIDELTELTLSGLDRGQRTVVPGARTKAVVATQRLSPAVGYRISRKRIGAVYQGPSAS
ncbi:3-alpha-(or 20-beta)-hydroxysteroid dehydrogenase [Mycobacterium attenuatum]|nr:3-alpha-(or 20-beta)-hydroxysteroid dehydrogenase [Mycobacterium attenuatum]